MRLFLLLMLLFVSVPVEAREYEDKPLIQVRILDKVTARARTFDLSVGQTVTYGNLRIKPRACRNSSPLDEPESAAFLQIWEVDLQGKRSWIFSGWMFASSPSLSAMDHPVYDVWVIDCLDNEAIKDPMSDDDSANEAADPAGINDTSVREQAE